METSNLLLLTLAFIFATARAGVLHGVLSALIVSVGGFPVVAYVTAQPPVHYGIAPGAPVVTSTQVLTLLLALMLMRRKQPMRIGPLITTFGLVAVVLALTTWGVHPQIQSGLLLLVTALLCFGIGRAMGSGPLEHSSGATVLVTTVLAVIALHTVAALLQSQGIPFGVAGNLEARHWVTVEGRMVGFYNHPAMLGKTVFVLLGALLPLSASPYRYVRLVAQSAIAIGLVGCLLTLSRANTVAIAAALVAWLIFNRRAVTAGQRVLTVAAGLIGALANLDAVTELQARNAEDPTGGPRDRLLATGIRQIKDYPFEGVGPNYYSEFVGRFDQLAATGFPVHNAFLLGAAELGIPLALIFFWPLVISGRSAAFRLRTSGSFDVRTAALVALLPGTALIALTGWGMLAEATLPLWFLTLGYLTPIASSSIDSTADVEGRDRTGVS